MTTTISESRNGLLFNTSNGLRFSPVLGMFQNFVELLAEIKAKTQVSLGKVSEELTLRSGWNSQSFQKTKVFADLLSGCH